MKEIRDIKIDLLTGNKNPIVELFNEITKDTMIIKCDVYHKHGSEFIYHKGGEWIFYQDCQNGEFWCNYKRYWSLFESNLKLEYQEIQAITKYLMEEALKREVGTPRKRSGIFYFSMEEALKREVGTPVKFKAIHSKVEEALKREVGTPSGEYLLGINRVEEALKQEVSTPNRSYQKSFGLVEDALKREIGTPHEEYFLLKIKVEDALKREINQTK